MFDSNSITNLLEKKKNGLNLDLDMIWKRD